MIPRRALGAAFVLACLASVSGCAVQVPPIEGMVWQIDNDTTVPKGDWDRLGAKRLLIQWTVVDNIAFREDTELPKGTLPDWPRIAKEPWAREVILGLAGYFDERTARSQIAQLAETSAKLAALPTPLNVVGYYFPVEIDPTWSEAPQLTALLAKLPRPLWISVYDSANVGPQELADGLLKWLPPDVGVFFQDGVGVHAREAWVARHYVTVLERSLGKGRVRVIAEAFRPKEGGGFRPATIDELRPQLATYAGLPIYLFEGPRYVTPALVDQLVKAGAGQASR
jgi:hypothetical protein